MYENKGKRTKWTEWAIPLMDHSGIHALLTLVIISVATGDHYLSAYAAIFDFVTHFITDRWKATRKTDPVTIINLFVERP